MLGYLILGALFADIAVNVRYARSQRQPVGTHRERHQFLHREFDELLADFLTHNRKALPSTSTIYELMLWSHAQTIKPDEPVGGGRLMSIMSSVRSFELWKKRSSPENVAEIERLIAAGKLDVTADPAECTGIIAGSWPSDLPGAERYTCDDCHCYVSLNSGAAVHAKFPNISVCCWLCAQKRIDAAAATRA